MEKSSITFIPFNRPFQSLFKLHFCLEAKLSSGAGSIQHPPRLSIGL